MQIQIRNTVYNKKIFPENFSYIQYIIFNLKHFFKLSKGEFKQRDTVTVKKSP